MLTYSTRVIAEECAFEGSEFNLSIRRLNALSPHFSREWSTVVSSIGESLDGYMLSNPHTLISSGTLSPKE
ncbi:hypothetical protein CNEO3_290029 [Clostridium neonatale]|uniref:Uncharacterized protein n=1 Tax=Clostridium neonatale TaxID=137838 RepID=A0AA86JLH7_9CLOT|nr:hypothetical protein CNEO_43442 [Clostridium neonatale]CAI3539350.1 hypothetical protein CNEO3_180062 [Clostridium neonatale]CAI3570014.1 hypothetical protein CNEO4_170021 [Clostridium neonatale]CAI3585741.1 hypothetical protein CNEO4_230020 [Clostridium neonatale]CAI3612663.1 hypothetical protein CNEO4_750008 [Clostridium neonatale]